MNAETYLSPEIGTQRWCPTCRRRVVIADHFEDSQWDTRGEVAIIVTALECGHDLCREGKVMMGHRSGGIHATPAAQTDPWAS